MKNKKIISLICAVAMIMSLFAGFTVNAAGEKGISLTAEMNSTATEITVVAKAVNIAESNIITDSTIAFALPDGVTLNDVTVASDVTWTTNVADGNLYLVYFDPAGKGVVFTDNVLATIKISVPAPLEKDCVFTLLPDASLSDEAGEVKVGKGTMEAATATAKNPIAKTEKPDGGKPTPFPAGDDDDVTPVEPTGKGIDLTATLNKTNDVLTVVAKAVNIADSKIITDSTIAFALPEGVTLNDVTVKSDVTWTTNVADGNLYLVYFDPAGKGVVFTDDVLATIEIKLPSQMTEKFAVTLLGDSSLSDEAGEVKVAKGTMTATSAVAEPSTDVDHGPSKTVDLEDYMGIDKATGKDATTVAKEAEENPDEYGDLWIDVKITKENDNGERVDAVYGTDYVAKYKGKTLTEKEYHDLISGNTDEKISDVIEGLQFEVYNSAKNVKINTELFAEKKDSSLVNKNDKEDVGSGTTEKDPTYKAATVSVSPASKTYTVGDSATIKFTYDAKDYATDAKLVLDIPSDLLDYVTATGIKVDDVKLTDAEFDGGYVIENAAKGTVTVTFKTADKTSKALEIKATLTGKNEKGEEMAKAASATSKVTIKAASTPDDDKKGSNNSTSSNGNGSGIIASGPMGTTYDSSIAGFTDMAGYDWAQEAVTNLALRNIVSGRGDGTFDPAGQITRAEYAQMVVNAIGMSSVYADTSFDDVPTDAWFYHNVAVASQLGIVAGYGDGNFGPYDLITREQMAAMTQRATVVIGKSLAGGNVYFADDADISDWAKGSVYELANAGIINGMGDGTFAPKANATRAQAAVIIYNALVK